MSAQILMSHCFETPLGTMIAVADEASLYLLDFSDRFHIPSKLEKVRKKNKIEIVEGINTPLKSIKDELKQYFSGKLTAFKTPIVLQGTSFQNMAWEELNRVPYGETRSYADQAKALGKPTAFRAVARANGTNLLAIIVPCHRIINTGGGLGGYSSGIERKEWLLKHEKKHR